MGMFGDMGSDLRFGARSLMRQKGAAALMLFTLTLAVTANVGVFTLIDGVFLRPLPFPHSDRLIYLNETAPKWDLHYTGINYPDFAAWRDHTTSFTAMGLFQEGDDNLSLGDDVERVKSAQVTYDLAKTLGIAPVLGRTFTAEEDAPHGPKAVMLGYGLWRSRFDGARDVIGRTLRINSQPYTIIGVLPPEAEFPDGAQLWLPIQADSAQPYEAYEYEGVARLKPGVDMQRARSDLLAAHAHIWDTRGERVVSPISLPLRDQLTGDYRTAGRVLGLAVLLVLLIACANVGSAMLTRATFRRREFAIRVALGASGARVARQLITEALMLAALASALGTLVGWWGIRLLVRSAPQLPAWVHLGFDPRLAGFAVLTVVVTSLLFGLAPALEARRPDMRETIGSGDARVSTTTRQRRQLDALAVGEVALATVLLVAGGLLVRAWLNLRHVDPGFQPRGVASFRIALPDVSYHDGRAQGAAFEAVLQRLEALPGVTGAGAISCPPFGCHWGSFYLADGEAPRKDGSNPVVLTRVASAGYFRAMGIRLVQGRFYRELEGNRDGYFPVVINREMAKLKWPGVANPVGRRLHMLGDSTHWMTVVGVAGSVRHYGLTRPMIAGLYMPMTYFDSATSVPSMAFVAHTDGSAAALVPEMRAAVRDVDPELPLFQVQTMHAALDASLAGRRTLMLVLGAFAATALVLALGGVYAVLAYTVGRRRREIGIRLALGARQHQIVGLVVRQGVRLVVIGLAIGVPAALATSRLLASLLVGVGRGDAPTYLAVVVLLAVTGVTAAVVPARRAAAVEPTAALAEQ
jgi:putative ABC transport system permease protein